MITLDSINSENASVEIKTEAGQALAIDGSGFITISNSSFAVTATDLDIRSLLFASDSVDVSGSSVTVSATDLDIRDLTQTDEITAYQGGTWAIAIDNMSNWKTSATTATTTAGELASTPLASRSKMIVQNLGSQDAWIGPDNTVTNTNGIKLPKGSSFDYPFDATANVWVITSSGTSDVRVLEASA